MSKEPASLPDKTRLHKCKLLFYLRISRHFASFFAGKEPYSSKPEVDPYHHNSKNETMDADLKAQETTDVAEVSLEDVI